jgi:hypothetical protein
VTSVNNRTIPPWWLISVGTVLVAYHGLLLFGTNPTVERFAGKLGIGKAVKWLEAFPSWQSPGTRRLGRVLAITMGLVFIVLGALRV